MEVEAINTELVENIKLRESQLFIKRIIDIVLSLIGIIVLSPFLLVIVLAIRLESKGSAVFKQKRVGKDDKLFTIYKFRTMIQGADKKQVLNIDPDKVGEFIFQTANDSRITKVGAFLRTTSLDELPQLFNVLIGNMSIVGPRPEIPEVVNYYPEKYKQRLKVLPGITGLAQISGRGEIELEKTIYYDLTYIKEFSVVNDLKIMWKTFEIVIKKEGAM
ncbi:sugar transferase [Clostridium sp. DL1XJH146]